jgi:hypothetical protein
MNLQHALRKLALSFYTHGVFKDSAHPDAILLNGEKGFKLKAHDSRPDLPPSPFFLNLRTSENPKPGPLTPAMVQEAGRLMCQKSIQLGLAYQHVVGLPPQLSQDCVRLGEGRAGGLQEDRSGQVHHR